MSANKGKFLAAFMVGLLTLYAFVFFAKGGLFISKHEGDTLHLLQMLLRMGQGDWPHLDFVTPIGVLAFAPISVFLEAGLGVGHAIHAGQLLVAIVFCPLAWWVAKTRYEGWWAYLFAATILIFAVALVYGEGDDSVSISMHYNRWAWAAAFLAITAATLPARDQASSRMDGFVIGLAMAVMAMIKVTYFAAFFIPVLVALFARGAGRTALWALVTGILMAALVTLWVGTPLIWLAYLRDLLNVAASDVRPQPGRDFGYVVSAPAYLGGSLIAVLSVIFLRQAGRMTEGMVLLLLLPGFFYVTFQNFGNDPQWLWLLGLLLVALRPTGPVFNGFGWDVQKAISLAAVAAFAFAIPSFLNLAASPFRHLATDVEKYVPLMPGSGVHEDLQTYAPRAARVDVRRAFDGPDTLFAGLYDDEARKDTNVIFQGRDFDYCTLELGMVVWFRAVSEDIANWSGGGKALFSADLLSSYWLYADLTPLKGGAPWYYGDLSGIENADYLLVPNCPLSADTRKKILDEVSGQDWIDQVVEARRTPYYTLYSLPGEKPKRVDPPAGDDESDEVDAY
ncbi:hypothetical protein MUY35_13635 [Aliiroseovarius sp. S1339]|uniref:hypothetical protein n=1 Tax=Aliiroseovarius sp. S1339 TaxID=2936990 RepID=UPI0020BE25E4|nr:hypothetical protein [Aliiroseovarius sp. S1339]MCK8464895.1 hypothetical protein [Aliiroseovarius sp. S1339]